MTRITLPPDVARQLREAGGNALLYDDGGRLVAEAVGPNGYVVVATSREMTAEEFEQVRRAGEGVKTADLLARLKDR